MTLSVIVVYGFAVLATLGSWTYFRTRRIARPPFGVMNLSDVAIAMTGILLVPFLYLWLPLPVVVVLVAAITLSALQITLEPVIRGAVLWGLCATLLGLDLALGLVVSVKGPAFLVVNNLIVVIVVVGVANLWAQSGLRASHTALFAAALVVYDAVTTWSFTVTLDLFVKLTKAPLFPLVGWGLTRVSTSYLVGLGDLLFVALFPLVMRKAYGRTAGLCALVAGLAALGLVFALVLNDVIGHTIPAMVFLGPLIVAQYLYWRLARGGERSTRQYLRADPLPARTPTLVTAAEGGEQR
ncbi:hypothetical protein ACFOY4_12975 [Actinomadura syzygii]|uniref:Uncharacterized protein n=1 Tax=Actinomadura syzygii TaxID=1427538 RepID=A0A5D0U797_9ACTN|nr:hypothetical protein [Actinomadura syzygii]TYC13844.1 hypothetical protein FXF65_19520 [Actinomadura syzygii]